MKKVPVRIRVIWNLEIFESGGDTHQSMTEGARSDLLVQQLPEHGLNVELLVAPKNDLIDVEAAVQRCI